MLDLIMESIKQGHIIILSDFAPEETTIEILHAKTHSGAKCFIIHTNGIPTDDATPRNIRRKIKSALDEGFQWA